jgi:hypothetical protein
VTLRETFATAGGAGGLRWVTGDPSALGESGSLGELVIDTATGTIYQNTNGATTWTAIHASSSVAITKPANPGANLNLSSDAGSSIDWWRPWSTNNPSSITGGVNLRGKQNAPGWVINSYKWIQEGSMVSSTVVGPTLFASNAADDLYTVSALSANNLWQGFSCSDNSAAGFKLALPLSPTQRVCRLHMAHWNNTVQLDVATTDGVVATNSTDVVDQANAFFTWKIVYSGPRGEFLKLRMRVTGRTSAVPSTASNVFLGAIQLGAT